MSKELALILEYESARREIKRLGVEIQESTCHPFNLVDFYKPKCSEVDEDTPQCFERLWDWNTKHRAYDRHWAYEESDEPEPSRRRRATRALRILQDNPKPHRSAQGR